ncbi:MAG TPA: amidohydrolase family protein [Pirellulales bacterium]|jgi:cytosine/adenosine deaminase-related metal-dependent hydrolase|nr:amidohydrolase family protein [Pirellulales bacterium]
MDDKPPVRLRARYVFTAAGPPLRDAVITLAGSRIASVGKRRADKSANDLGNAAILPGLVNAHTHLEFSDLKSPLGSHGMRFADWIHAVVAYRRRRTDAKRQAASLKGIAESIRFGTTTLGEIATAGWLLEAFARDAPSSPESTVFLETIGLRRNRFQAGLDAAKEHLTLSAKRGIRIGLSPHAPYTVSPEMVRRLAALSAVAAIPLTMHIAESPEELELLRTGKGPLRDMLVKLDAWDPQAVPPGSSPLDYLRMIARAHRALVIHGNYLSDEEIAFIGANSQRLSVVYCPRTHAYFKHAPYPLGKLLKAGITVALGTDSRASNPDLNLFAEMRHVADHHSVAPHRIVAMGTLDGARALGRDNELGSLERGKRADLVVIRLPDAATRDPYELLFDARSFVETTIHQGRVVAGKPLTSGNS